MFTHRSVQKESSLALLRPHGEQISGADPGGVNRVASHLHFGSLFCCCFFKVNCISLVDK